MNEIIERLRKLSESLRQTQAFDNLNQLDKDIDEIEKIFDRETPKKPILSDTWKDEEQTDIYDENGFIDPIVSICPNCRKYGIFDFEYGEKFNYCKHCGQAIDWSDEDVEQRKM